MSADEMTDRITELLQEGIRETIENRDDTAFERAAKAAYTVRTAGLALSDDDAIINHVLGSFNIDIEKIVSRYEINYTSGDAGTKTVHSKSWRAFYD